MRKKIVAGNWKMNLTMPEALALFSEIVHIVKDEKNNHQEVIVCAPFPYLHSLTHLSENAVHVGAQNCHQELKGAFTGEISVSMLQSVGVSHVIIGHSERRQYFAETDAMLAQKVNHCIEEHLTPIFCIGETLEQRENGSYFEVIKSQLANGLFHLSPEDFSKNILAYEPVWAIGTGKTASPEQAQEIHAFIRNEIKNQFGEVIADGMSILYGGSCNPANAAELFAKADIDGGLIGGASLKSRDFVDIVKAFN